MTGVFNQELGDTEWTLASMPWMSDLPTIVAAALPMARMLASIAAMQAMETNAMRTYITFRQPMSMARNSDKMTAGMANRALTISPASTI